ncbi:MAG: hypothetical protein Q8Q09_14325 [Deltaproteobacteria bacterium]|nr:hypothetical protein [Deltaproteobacteria bacterium]
MSYLAPLSGFSRRPLTWLARAATVACLAGCGASLSAGADGDTDPDAAVFALMASNPLSDPRQDGAAGDAAGDAASEAAAAVRSDRASTRVELNIRSNIEGRALTLMARQWLDGASRPATYTVIAQQPANARGAFATQVILQPPAGVALNARMYVQLEATLARTATEPTQVLRRYVAFSFVPNQVMQSALTLVASCDGLSPECPNTPLDVCNVQTVCEVRNMRCGGGGACRAR